MAVKQLPKISDLPEPPDRLVGDQERFDVLTFNSLKAQKKMVNEDLNKALIPALNEFAVDVNASVDAAALSERNAHDSEEVAKRKAGEASGSAGAAKVSEDNAKVSETNALASKNAAALSAESAEADRIAAEAARDEAQDLANVGFASEIHAGLAKVDGKTTQADAGGVITVKDVAIGGDSSDLASARGQVGDLKIATATNYPSILTICKSCRLYFNGTEWGKVADRPFEAGYGAVVIADVSSDALRGEIWAFSLSGNDAWKAQFNEKGTSPFARFVMSNAIGDGIRVTNGIISVPEYEGATASTAGTSGLVPPATAGQHESFLTGGGEYKPALTKISDSVSLADSTTAASAKAVRTAYDLANSKQANLGFTPVQQSGGAGQEGQKIYIGWSPSGLKAQAGVLDLGNIVTTSAGCMKAPSAANADYANTANGIGGHSWLDVIDTGGNPQWVVGLATDGSDKIKPIQPASLRVEYANSAGSAPANGGTAWATTTVPNVAIGDTNQAVPAGGTWTFIVSRNGAGNMGTIAGGTVINQGVWLAIRVA